MLRRIIFFLAILGFWALQAAFADDEPPKSLDVQKYEFARSYITALKYMKDIDDRWAQDTPKKLFADQKNKMILATINDLSLDSSDLLVIKNYMRKYLLSPSMDMRRVAEIVVVSVAREIAINHDQKLLWEKWYDLNAAGQATRPKEIDFVKTQHSLEMRRKEEDKNIIQASIGMTKILMSDKNKKNHGHLLDITAQERQKLLDKLDSFGADELDWGLKTGQSTLEGSIAVIREILEDSLWTSIDEK